MSLLTPELQLKIATFRRKAADGTITLEEMREAVSIMRQGRISAAQTATKSRTKAEAPDAKALLSRLRGITPAQ